MCYYLTIGTDISAERLKTCVGDSFCIEEARRHQYFRKHMPKATILVNLTDGHCSCSICCEGESKGDSEKRLRRKYEKKGFSENRIKRILDEKDIVFNRNKSQSLLIIEVLKSILSEGTLLYVYTHMYTGRIEDEKLPIPKTKPISIDSLKTPLRSWLIDDTIVCFRKQLD